eukprot:gnl/TRDRNA2_/TRDRNA2_88018_c0_seq1.p1 gnl/TRDRNA2_/TRDRNA2_88018_c0~~gnl/TRDRNA2_/TRDRNA2_88018_c0_seq1.p1  ORF type:complete len:401 (-),score=80.51 gnl/TRDRNA2_/TRDRNA2_88018_c0_seq1:62-1264(-)
MSEPGATLGELMLQDAAPRRSQCGRGAGCLFLLIGFGSAVLWGAQRLNVQEPAVDIAGAYLQTAKTQPAKALHYMPSRAAQEFSQPTMTQQFPVSRNFMSPQSASPWTSYRSQPVAGALPERQMSTPGVRISSCTGYWQFFQNGKSAGHNVKAGAAADSAAGALLCDCDGTLVETERDGHRISFNRAFAEKGYPVEWDVELYGELLTTGGGKERMARYFKDYNPTAWETVKNYDEPKKDHPAIVELHKRKTEIFMDIVRAGELPLREGVKDLLAAASSAGWTLAVCSTSNEKAVTAVVETMLPQYAGQMKVFAGDMAKKKKPDPEIYNMASKELGISPSKCVVLEDTNIGMQAGKAAGMMVVVTKSIYSADEDFGTADLVVASAADVNFETAVKPMIAGS